MLYGLQKVELSIKIMISLISLLVWKIDIWFERSRVVNEKSQFELKWNTFILLLDDLLIFTS